MIQYEIHLKTVDDFRKYANMMVRFPIAGYVELRETEIDMYDILEIMSQGPVESMLLCLTKYKNADIPELEKYMEEAHFFNRDRLENASESA